jgi:ABC-type bacteriocin/lantibiotic exporter with double-glycine peptidase domain
MNLLPVKAFQETLNAGMCGPASLKMVLEYWGISKTEQELAELCRTDCELGTTDVSIKEAAESLGCTVAIVNNASFEDIRSFLDREVPVIVNWFTKGRKDTSDSEVPDGHYSVVVGLDDEYIYLQDPEIGGLRKIEKDDFLRVWFDFTGSQINTWDEMIIRQLIAVYK